MDNTIKSPSIPTDLDITNILSNITDSPNEIKPGETNFEKVVKFNKLFGVPTHSTPQISVCLQNPKLTKLRMDLITEEVEGTFKRRKFH